MIEELLEKYYHGDTSTAEENTLRDYFRSGKVPAHLEADARMFRYFSARDKDTLPGDLQSRLESMVDSAERDSVDSAEQAQAEDAGLTHTNRVEQNKAAEPIKRQIGGGIKLRYYWYTGAAAVILILLGLFIDMQIKKNGLYEVRQDTYDDPYIAYAEARRVLYLVSDKMNSGRKPLKNIEKLDAGVEYMHPVFSFGSGIQHLDHLNRLEETRQLISN